MQPRIAPHVQRVFAVQRVGDVGLAVLQHRHPRGALGDALHDEASDVGHVPPVARIRLHHHLDAGLVADELVGTGADRMLAEAVVADLGHVFLRDDEARGRRGGAVEGHEVRPRLGETEAHGQWVDDLDGANVSLQLLRASALVALEAELHVLGGQRVAVVELEVAAQLELVHESVGALGPGLGQTRRHLALARQGPDQRVVEREQHPERGDLRGRARRIEPGRRDRDVPGDGHLAGRRRLRDSLPDRAQHQDCRHEQRDRTTEGPRRPPTKLHGLYPPIVRQRIRSKVVHVKDEYIRGDEARLEYAPRDRARDGALRLRHDPAADDAAESPTGSAGHVDGHLGRHALDAGRARAAAGYASRRRLARSLGPARTRAAQRLGRPDLQGPRRAGLGERSRAARRLERTAHAGHRANDGQRRTDHTRAGGSAPPHGNGNVARELGAAGPRGARPPGGERAPRLRVRKRRHIRSPGAWNHV